MIQRRIQERIKTALQRQAAVAIVGPRQVGKTTLALEIAEKFESLYLDLEKRSDRDKLADPELFLGQYEDRLVVLDEIHRIPELFQSLRGIIDEGRRKGKRTGRFLLLGSAAIELLRQTGETLAGRIAFVNMNPLDILEVDDSDSARARLWIRGGFPDSFLAQDDGESLAIRKDFIRTYLERDVPMFGPRIPAETLERLWTMLAHNNGTLLNASKLASSLSTSAQTVTRYVDLLIDLLLVRRLQPYHGNVKKRLIKSPKIYVRDTGLLHALLELPNYNAIAGHPVAGASWEGFVIENLMACVPERTLASFYRTGAGAEIDLVLELPGGARWAIEIKLGSSPTREKGFYHAREAVQPDRSFVVYSGTERYFISEDVEAIGLRELAQELNALG